MSVENKFENYFEKLTDSYDLDEAVQKKLFQEFREYALQHRNSFLSVFSAIPTSDDRLLSEVYEALSQDLENWQDFFINEFKRLFSAAEETENPEGELNNLLSLDIWGDKKDSPFSKKIRNILVDKIERSRNNRVRRIAVSLLGSFTFFNNDREIRLLEELKTDRDWRTRFLAGQALNDVNSSAPTEGIAFLDIIRNKLFNAYKI